jgi:hypothetical protein
MRRQTNPLRKRTFVRCIRASLTRGQVLTLHREQRRDSPSRKPCDGAARVCVACACGSADETVGYGRPIVLSIKQMHPNAANGQTGSRPYKSSAIQKDVKQAPVAVALQLARLTETDKQALIKQTRECHEVHSSCIFLSAPPQHKT